MQSLPCSVRNTDCDVHSSDGCAVTRGDVDLAWYAARDKVWRDLGLAAPARRALVNAGILETAQLRDYTAEQILALHGIGKTALPALAPYLGPR